jgi:predicted patatin/cPLA2 family phospholipase
MTTGKNKFGLVLEGGGMRGLFTAGVLDVFMEKGIKFDGLIGVSAGACFGCNYKSRQIGRVIRYNKRFAQDSRYCSWRSLITTGDIFGADFCYRKLPKELDIFDAKTFESNPMEFHLVATNAETGESVYKKLDKADDLTLDWIRASASMPLVSRPVRIDGGIYLDGGLSDGIPLKYFESIGFSKNIVITTRPKGYRKFPRTIISAVKPFLHRYPAVYQALKTRHIWYNNTLEYIDRRVKDGAALLIAPKEPLQISRICHNPDVMQNIYDLGRKAAEDIDLTDYIKAY